MMSRTKYLVVVYLPKPKQQATNPLGAQSSTWTTENGPKVQWITASSAQEAASMANVSPGGHALVVAEQDVERFDRAEQAPLERRMVDGSLAPTGVAA